MHIKWLCIYKGFKINNDDCVYVDYIQTTHLFINIYNFCGLGDDGPHNDGSIGFCSDSLFGAQREFKLELASGLPAVWWLLPRNERRRGGFLYCSGSFDVPRRPLCICTQEIDLKACNEIHLCENFKRVRCMICFLLCCVTRMYCGSCCKSVSSYT